MKSSQATNLQKFLDGYFYDKCTPEAFISSCLSQIKLCGMSKERCMYELQKYCFWCYIYNQLTSYLRLYIDAHESNHAE